MDRPQNMDRYRSEGEPIQVGLIGYGFAGRTFHAPILTSVPGLTLRTVVSSRPDEVARDYPSARSVTDVESLFADDAVDLVVIATPNTSHASLAKQALRAGKHVVVEKPFVHSVADGIELIQTAEETDRMLTVYHNRRWDNNFRTVKRILERGDLGAVRLYEAQFDRFRPNVRDRWREHPLPGSGTLFDLGSHLIDQVLQLFGDPDSVFADIRQQREGSVTVDDFHVVLSYPEFRAVLRSNSYVRISSARFVVHGTNGSFVKYGTDPQEQALIRGDRPGTAGWGMDEESAYGELVCGKDADVKVTAARVIGANSREKLPDTLVKVPTENGCYEAFYQGVVESIVKRVAPPVKAEDALKVIEVIAAAMESHRTGRTVQFNSIFAK